MIGGEFEIDLNKRSDRFIPAPDTYYYASGRTALYQILKSIAPIRRRVWLPDYLCHTIVEAVVKAGYEYSFYELDACFMATTAALESSGFQAGDIVLIINYFGLQDLTQVAKGIKDAFPEATVIEDDVQAYWAFTEKGNPYADYRFTSLRKALPVPDGGLVYTKNEMPAASCPNTFAQLKIDAGVMKSNRGKEGIRDEEYLSLFEEGARLINENYESVMSPMGQSLFAGVDVDEAKQRRQLNSAYLMNGLAAMGISTLVTIPMDSAPLFIPIYLDNRDEVRRRMFAHHVFCPVHWPLNGLPLKRGAEMAKHELSLIVDQRYSEIDMETILSLL